MAYAYAVVVFEDDDPPSVAVVPQAWLKSQPNGMFCYWPRYGVSQKSRKGEAPDKDKWTIFKVRILMHADTYEKALIYAKKSEFTSNLSSDDEITEKRVRKKKVPYGDNNDADDEEVVPKRQKSQVPISEPTSLPVAPAFDTTRMAPDVPEQGTQVNLPDLQEQGGTPQVLPDLPEEGRDGFEKKVLGLLQQILNTQNRQEEMLGSLVAEKSEAVLEDLIPTPFDNDDAFNQFNIEVEEKTYRRKIVSFLVPFGGFTCMESLRRMIKKIGTNRLWAMYSLRGKKGKKALQDLPVYRVLCRAAMKVHPKARRPDIEDCLIEILKHAPHLPGGPKYKAPAKKGRLPELDISDSD